MPKLHDHFGRRSHVAIDDERLSSRALDQLSDEFRALPMMFRTVGLLLHSKSTAYEQILARDYNLLMSYDMRHIVALKPPVLELEGGGTSAPRHRQAGIAML
jgi:hypothetical protein